MSLFLRPLNFLLLRVKGIITFKSFQLFLRPRVVVHVCNPSTQETQEEEAGGS
jgi:hypothetical protein